MAAVPANEVRFAALRHRIFWQRNMNAPLPAADAQAQRGRVEPEE